MLNKVILIGRLTKDPELRYTPNGKAVANFTLAVDRGMKDQDGSNQADFIRVTVWDKQAENVSKFLVKGRLVSIEGSIRTGSYEKDGQRVYTTDIQAQRVIFLEWGDRADGGNSNSGGSGGDVFTPEDLDDDDVPF